MQIIYQKPQPDPNPPPPLPASLPQKRNLTRIFLIGLILFSLSLALITAYLYTHPPLLTPLGDTAKILELNLKSRHKPQKIVYGFLPYWNFKYYQDIPYHLLSHLALFGLGVNPDGSFLRLEADYTEPGWRALNSPTVSTIRRFTQASHTKLILVIRVFDDQIIGSLLTDPQASASLIDNTLSFLDQHQLDGVNLDFEPTQSPDASLRQLFTQFTATFSARLKAQNPSYHLSVDVYAESAKNPRLWDLPALTRYVDHLIIMAYDFHRPASPVAGPVAPLYGAGQLWSEDITSLLALHLDLNPSNQIILGVPFYGYEWRTTTNEFLSPTVPRSGVLATYARVHDLLNAPASTLSAQWHDSSMSPWIVYQRPDVDYFNQIHFENQESLGLKYDLVNQSNLAGIAIWALGYEVPHQEPWDIINQKFPPNK